jgi:DNA-binding XRE family transcriptional regulator
LDTQNSRLRKFRESLDLNQGDMAKKFGKGQTTYAYWEKDDAGLPPEALPILSEMGLNLNWLATGEGSMHKYGIVPESQRSDSKQAYLDKTSERIKEVMSTGRYPKVTAADLAIADQWVDELVLHGRHKNHPERWEWIQMAADFLAEARFAGETVSDARAKVERLVRLAKGLKYSE